LKHIIAIDACVYSPSNSALAQTGFGDWKRAGTGKVQNEEGTDAHLKGPAKYVNSQTHKEAMKIWEERKLRSTRSSLSVDTMVLHRMPENRWWVETVFIVVKYLVINGIPFRGYLENTNFLLENIGGGVYLNTFAKLLLDWMNAKSKMWKSEC